MAVPRPAPVSAIMLYQNRSSRCTRKELIHTRLWPSLASLERETSDWISNYYNPLRRHSTLGYLTPVEYETRV